jgi:hypothetical protein
MRGRACNGGTGGHHHKGRDSLKSQRLAHLDRTGLHYAVLGSFGSW